MHDMREMIDTRGRLISPERLKEPLQLPALQFKTIQNEPMELGKLRNTLLCVSSSALGLESLSAVIKEALQNDRSILCIHLLHGYLRYSLFYYPLRRHLRAQEQTDNAILRGPVDVFRELGVLNAYGGYAFWISKSGNITWRSSGGLTIPELKDFQNTVAC